MGEALNATEYPTKPKSVPYNQEFSAPYPPVPKALRLRKLDLEQGGFKLVLAIEPFSNEIFGRIPIAKLDF